MEKKRSRTDILAAILCLAENGERKTHLLYRSNLSYTRLNFYLNSLLEIGLLKESRNKDGDRVYVITDKGRKFLSNYRQLSDLGLHSPEAKV